MTELRSLSKNIQNLYNYIINPYDADIFICVQESSNNDYESIKLFSKNVMYNEIYKRPDPNKYFGEPNNTNIQCKGIDNWNMPSNLQIYINYHKMSEIIKDKVNDYDYFITMRTDVCILFPFPRKELFDIIPKSLYSFDSEYSKEWGGSGYCVFIHKNYILKYLSCYYDVISNDKYKNDLINNFYNPIKKELLCNQEKFQKICIKIMNIDNPKYIKNINLFYNATTLTDYTTWSKPKLHPKYKVICKYIEQCDEAYNNLKLWYMGARWNYNNDYLYLEFPESIKTIINQRKNILNKQAKNSNKKLKYIFNNII